MTVILQHPAFYYYYYYFRGGHRLQKVMQQLHLKLKEVQHILRSGSKSSPKYHAGQLSVDYLASAILSSSHPATTEQDEGYIILFTFLVFISNYPFFFFFFVKLCFVTCLITFSILKIHILP